MVGLSAQQFRNWKALFSPTFGEETKQSCLEALCFVDWQLIKLADRQFAMKKLFDKTQYYIMLCDFQSLWFRHGKTAEIATEYEIFHSQSGVDFQMTSLLDRLCACLTSDRAIVGAHTSSTTTSVKLRKPATFEFDESGNGGVLFDVLTVIHELKLDEKTLLPFAWHFAVFKCANDDDVVKTVIRDQLVLPLIFVASTLERECSTLVEHVKTRETQIAEHFKGTQIPKALRTRLNVHNNLYVPVLNDSNVNVVQTTTTINVFGSDSFPKRINDKYIHDSRRANDETPTQTPTTSTTTTTTMTTAAVTNDSDSNRQSSAEYQTPTTSMPSTSLPLSQSPGRSVVRLVGICDDLGEPPSQHMAIDQHKSTKNNASVSRTAAVAATVKSEPIAKGAAKSSTTSATTTTSKLQSTTTTATTMTHSSSTTAATSTTTTTTPSTTTTTTTTLVRAVSVIGDTPDELRRREEIERLKKEAASREAKKRKIGFR